MTIEEKYIVDKQGDVQSVILPVETYRKLNENGHLKAESRPRGLMRAIDNKSIQRTILCGLGRSGTSLTFKLMNAHPDVVMTYESIYKPFLYNDNLELLHELYFEMVKFYRTCNNSLMAAYDHMKENYGDRQYSYFGDKTIYQENEDFRRRLVNAVSDNKLDKLVLIIRDPRAMISSMIRYLNSLNQRYPEYEPQQFNLNNYMRKWANFAEDASKLLQHKDSVLLLHYESLVANPEQVITSILDFLKLDKNDYPEELFNMAHPDSINAWQHKLDPAIRTQIESTIGPLIKQAGYDL